MLFNKTCRRWDEGNQAEALEYLDQQENKGALVDLLGTIQSGVGSLGSEVHEVVLSSLVGLVSSSFEE